jgi:drug/metabolite transporter (DMT)-like permease
MIRLSTAGLCLTPFALYRILHLRRRYPLGKLLISAASGTALPAFLFATAQTEVPSSTAGVLNSSTPVFVFIMGLVFFRQAFKWRQALGLLLGIIGAVTLILNKPGAGFEWNHTLFGSFAVIATINYAFNANFVSRYLKALHPLDIASVGMMMIGVPMLLPLLLATDFLPKLASETQAWHSLGFLLILGAVGTAFMKVLFYRMVHLAGPVFATAVSYAIPIVALFWGVLDGEHLGWSHAVGLVGILSGVYLISHKKNAQAPPAPESEEGAANPPATIALTTSEQAQQEAPSAPAGDYQRAETAR